MNNWRKHVVIGLVICLLQLSLADVAFSADTTALNPSLTRQRVDQFGVGAKVKVELTNGQKFKGSIQSIEEGGFLLAANAGSPTQVPYGDIAKLNLTKNTYKTTGQPDSVAVRRVVSELGVGHHIMVKTVAGKEYHGNIQTISQNDFTLLPDHQTTPVQIAYNDMVQLGPNLSTTAKVVIVVAVAAVVALTVLVIVLTMDVVRAAK